MGLHEMERALETIRSNLDLAHFHGPKPLTLIEKAESALGLRFPPSYRLFLRELGCGGFAGHEFYGVIDEDFATSSIPDAIWLTLKDRRQFALAHSLVHVYSTGYGPDFAINTDRVDDANECPVVEWFREQPLRDISPDFGCFFLETIQQALFFKS